VVDINSSSKPHSTSDRQHSKHDRIRILPYNIINR